MTFVDTLRKGVPERVIEGHWCTDNEALDAMIEEAAQLIEDMTLALLQYRDDLNYPPTKDSLSRRIEMIESLLKRV